MVHYQGKFHLRLGIDHQLLPPVEFLAMLVPHVALKYEVTVRSYGALSATFRKRSGWIQQPPTDEPPRLAIAGPPGVSHPEPPRPPPPLDSPLTSRPGSASCPQHDEDSDFIRPRKRGWAKLTSKIWKPWARVPICLGAPLSLDWGCMYYPRTDGSLMHSTALPESAIRCPWDKDLPSLDAGANWGNYAGTKTVQEEFNAA